MARVVLIAATFPLPLMNVLSAGLVAFTAQVMGWRVAAVDAALAAALLGLLLSAAGGVSVAGVAGAAGLWALTIVGGSTVGRYGSMSFALQIVVGLALIGILVAAVAVPDSAAFWEPVLRELLARADMAQFAEPLGEDLGRAAAAMNGVIAASLVVSVMISLALGAWLAAGVGGPALGRLFRALTLGRVLSGCAVVAGLAALAGAPPVAGHALLVLAIGLTFQGLSVLHWVAYRREWPAAWSLLLYGPMLLSPAIAVMAMVPLTVLGLMDNWRPLRSRSGDMLK